MKTDACQYSWKECPGQTESVGKPQGYFEDIKALKILTGSIKYC